MECSSSVMFLMFQWNTWCSGDGKNFEKLKIQNQEKVVRKERHLSVTTAVFHNIGLLQYLHICRRRNITNNGNQTVTNDANNDNTNNNNNSNCNNIPDKIESQEKSLGFGGRKYFQKGLKQCMWKDCPLEEELVYATKWSGWWKVCRRSYMKLWIQDTPLKSISLKPVLLMLLLLL